MNLYKPSPGCGRGCLPRAGSVPTVAGPVRVLRLLALILVGVSYWANVISRVALRFPNGKEIRVNCRHDFAGNSQWNPAHGVMKAQALGVRDHLAMAGHKHVSAYGVQKDPDSGITMHGILVASYKVYDRFAREKGFRDQALGPACLTVIDPSLPETHPDLIKPFWDPFEGADYLAFKRRRVAA